MKKETREIKIENIETLFAITLVVIVATVLVTVFLFYNFSRLRTEHDSVLDAYVQLKCPLMQYETQEPYYTQVIKEPLINDFCTWHCSALAIIYSISKLPINNTDCISQCLKDNSINITLYNSTYKNFTTGFYNSTTGNITCEADLICTISNYQDCLKGIGSYYEHQQDFTLEEMGIK